MHCFLIVLLLILTNIEPTKPFIPQFIETQATITSIETNQSGRRTSSMAKVDFVTKVGDSISSQVQLSGFPILGSFKKEGDNVTILYDENNPYLIKSKGASIFQSYGFYLFITFGLLITGYKFLRKDK